MRKIWFIFLLLVSLNLLSSNTHAQNSAYHEILIIPHDSPVMSINWHPTENKIVSTSENSIYVWDVQSGDLLQNFEAYPGEVVSVAWDPQGTRLATLGDDYMYHLYAVKIWEADGTLLQQLDAISALSISWSPDGEFLLTVDDLIPDPLESIYVFSAWRSQTGELEYRFTLSAGWTGQPYHKNHPDVAIWLSNEQFIGVNHAGPISIWNLPSQELIRTYYEPQGQPGIVDYSTTQSVALNPFMNLFAVTSNTNLGRIYQINILDLSSGEYIQLESPSGIRAVAWSPDGQLLAYSNSEGTIIRSAANYEIIDTLAAQDPVTSISWSPDGTYLATASLDGTVRIWSAANQATNANN